MSTGNTICCLTCHVTFSSNEKHTCIEMKDDKIEVEERIFDKENESDNIPKMKKNKIVKKGGIFQIENCENFSGEEKNKRESPKSPESDIIDVETIEYQDEEQVSANSNFEQFIADTIQQVDELCENIKTGDPDTKRSEEVNLKLKSAVDCYRKLGSENQIFVEIENVENHNEIRQRPSRIIRPWVDNGFNSKDLLHDSKEVEKKSKGSKAPEERKKGGEKIKTIDNENNQPEKNRHRRAGRPRKRCTDEKFELVKNQCGRHQISSMARMLSVNASRLKLRIEEEGITFVKKIVECRFCEMKRNADEIKSESLLPFLKFNIVENKFQCVACNSPCTGRNDMYKHMRVKHGNEIVTKALTNTKSENHQKCDGSLCKIVYGSVGIGTTFWCKKCMKELKSNEEMKKEYKAKVFQVIIYFHQPISPKG